MLNELMPADVQKTLVVMEKHSITYDRKIDLIISAQTPVGLLRNQRLRGMILNQLPRGQAEQLATKLQIRWSGSPYPSLQKASIPKESEREMVLFEFFEEPAPQSDETEVLPTTLDVLPQYGLFPHQLTALHKVMNLLESSQSRAFLHMPTGSGKTRTSMSLVARRALDERGSLVLWLAYNEELCEQAAREFQNTWSMVGDRPITLHRFYGKHKWAPPREGLIIAGLGKLWSLTKKDETVLANLARQVDLIVFDEAHQSIAATYELMVGIVLASNPDCRLLGLSATPGRTWDDPDKDRELAALYHHQKVALDVEGYGSPVDFLIAEGYLSDPDFRQLHVASGALTDADLKRAERETEYPAAILRKLGADQVRNIQIAKKVEAMIEEGHHRILIFATDVRHSEELALVLAGRDINASSITGETDREVRKARITHYLSDDESPAVLCNYGVLTTGFDAPRTSGAIIARPTKSLVLYSQMAGRVIRGEKVGGTARAEIWTVVDSQLPGFGSLSDAFWNWEDVW